jgi:hypothetical protein
MCSRLLLQLAAWNSLWVAPVCCVRARCTRFRHRGVASHDRGMCSVCAASQITFGCNSVRDGCSYRSSDGVPVRMWVLAASVLEYLEPAAAAAYSGG